MSESYCYIGTKPCGCVVAVVVDSPEEDKKIAVREMWRLIRDGMTVERVPTAAARARLRRCTCDEKPVSDTMDLFEDVPT